MRASSAGAPVKVRELGYTRVKHPSEALQIGQRVERTQRVRDAALPTGRAREPLEPVAEIANVVADDSHGQFQHSYAGHIRTDRNFQWVAPETARVRNRVFDRSCPTLSPEPLLQSRRMAQTAQRRDLRLRGELRWTDPTGLKITWTPSADPDFDRQVARLRGTPSGGALWDRLDARP